MKGFTLIELMVVVVILSVCMLFASPQFMRAYAHLSRETSADRLSDLAAYARERAIVSGRPIKLVIDAENGSFWLASSEGNDGSFERLTDRFGRVQKVRAGTTLRFMSDDNAVLFLPDGTCSNASIDIAGGGEAVRLETRSLLGRFDRLELHEGA